MIFTSLRVFNAENVEAWDTYKHNVNTLMKKKTMQLTWSYDDSNDSIDEENFIGELVTHDDVS